MYLQFPFQPKSVLFLPIALFSSYYIEITASSALAFTFTTQYIWLIQQSYLAEPAGNVGHMFVSPTALAPRAV